MNTKTKTKADEQAFPTFCAQLDITSPVFHENGNIPPQYTCDGANINPSLDIAAVPPGTKSLAVIMEDPDAPSNTWTHWLAWNIPVIKHIQENRKMEAEGRNDYHVDHYKGPCPAYGTHRYMFKVYALDSLLDLPPHSPIVDLETAMSGHILGFGQLVGKYKRK